MAQRAEGDGEQQADKDQQQNVCSAPDESDQKKRQHDAAQGRPETLTIAV